MASCQISMFRHETGSRYNSGMQCPICTKLHIFGESPGLKTPKGQKSDIIIAPPGDNGIYHALH